MCRLFARTCYYIAYTDNNITVRRTDTEIGHPPTTITSDGVDDVLDRPDSCASISRWFYRNGSRVGLEALSPFITHASHPPTRKTNYIQSCALRIISGAPGTDDVWFRSIISDMTRTHRRTDAVKSEWRKPSSPWDSNIIITRCIIIIIILVERFGGIV